MKNNDKKFNNVTQIIAFELTLGFVLAVVLNNNEEEAPVRRAEWEKQ